MPKSAVILSLITVFVILSNSDCKSDSYFVGDSAVSIRPSDIHIGIQFDTALTLSSASEFFSSHETLDDTVEVDETSRGFYVYGIAPGVGFDSAWSDVISDPTVKRCVPVYCLESDSAAEFPVTDLISVQFNDDLSREDALDILEESGLHFVDSSLYRPLYWRVALDDSIAESPLDRANEIHLLDETAWACPAMYCRPVFFGLPSDSLFPDQYYLRNTGQLGGLYGNDIDADSAWLFALTDSSLDVSVIDQGGEAHEDLGPLHPARDYDFSDGDNDPTPGELINHGMACAGLFAAKRNGLGIVGVNPTCELTHIKIANEDGSSVAAYLVAEAIYHAGWAGSVTSCSWGYDLLVPDIRDAIIWATNRCGPYPSRGLVVVAAAGNVGPTNSVRFPAYRPEVIAVGAIKRSGGVWDYSCRGLSLDVVAPAGGLGLGSGNTFTIDMEGERGWNPVETKDQSINDFGVNINYTRAMGGTSAACPQVAGIVSLILARGNPHISYCNPMPDILMILDSSAVDLAAAGRDDSTGYGRANAYRALVSISHGDVNGDNVFDVVDVVSIVNEAFRNGAPPTLHPALSDVNCTGTVDILDVVSIVNLAFRNDPAPVPCFIF